MKSSIYEISGCQGSQHWREIRTFETMPEAKKAARKANVASANSCGESLRAFRKGCNFGEGWTFAAKTGLDGRKY